MRSKPPIPAELWEQIPAAARAALLAAFAGYEQQLAALRAEVTGLRAQLGQDSTNSSRPPSSDAPAGKRAPPRAPSGRSKGGQPGHPIQQPAPLPPDCIEAGQPAACRRCGSALHGDDPEPVRHQVMELPPVRPTVTEYRLHRLTCAACGTSTCADLPDGTPRGQYGPRLQAVLALLTGAYRLSKRQVEQLCADLFGVPVSAAQVCALERQTTRALDPAVAELREHVEGASGNMDETGWREGGRRAWLWVFVTRSVTVFRIALSRSAKVARELLGAPRPGVVTTDRFSAYNWLPVHRRQLCWAHLVRDFQAMVDRGNEGSVVGEELLSWAECVFNWWHRVRDGTLSRATLRKYLGEIRPCFRDDLEAGAACGCAKTAAVCRGLLSREAAPWTFARREGTEPTNNAAERALRHAVLWRKTSYGTESEVGSRFVENILTVVATCRQRGLNALEYLTGCCRAAIRRSAPPSLLPLT